MIVVDNASSDGTADAASSVPGVEVVRLGRNCGAAARNHAVLRLQTPYVAFSDDDSWWAPGALARAERLFKRHPQLGLIAGRIMVGPDGRVDPGCEAMNRSPLGHPPGCPGPAVLGFIACGAIVRRSAFLDAGGFDPALHIAGEETLLALDMASSGWDLAYVDDVVAHHHPYPDSREGRRTLELRNQLWITWLRRPVPLAMRLTGRTAWHARRQGEARAALRGIVPLIPRVLRSRERLPASVETMMRVLDDAGTTARA